MSRIANTFKKCFSFFLYLAFAKVTQMININLNMRCIWGKISKDANRDWLLPQKQPRNDAVDKNQTFQYLLTSFFAKNLHPANLLAMSGKLQLSTAAHAWRRNLASQEHLPPCSDACDFSVFSLWR